MSSGVKFTWVILLVIKEPTQASGFTCQLLGLAGFQLSGTGWLSGRVTRGKCTMDVSSASRLAWAVHGSPAFQEEQRDESNA